MEATTTQLRRPFFRKPKPIQAALVIFTSVGIGLAQTIFSVLSSDITFYWPPFYSQLLNALVIPTFFLVVPTLALFAAFLALRSLGHVITTSFLAAVMSAGAILWLLRLYYLRTGGAYDSLSFTVLGFVALFLLMVLLHRVFFSLFSIGSVLVLLATLNFAHKQYVALAEPQSVKVQLAYDKPQAQHDVPVFVLLFDELSAFVLRDDENSFDRTLFPHIGKLIDDGTWYVNATTGDSCTAITVRSMLSGLDLFAEYDSTNCPADVPNVFDYLSGYRHCRVFETMRLAGTQPWLRTTSLSATARLWNYIKVIATVYASSAFHSRWVTLPDIDMLFTAFEHPTPATSVNIAKAWDGFFQNFVSEISSRKDQMLFFYSVYPHAAYARGPAGDVISFRPKGSPKDNGQRVPESSTRRYHAGGAPGGGETIPNTTRSYINQVRFVDRLVGRIVARIKEQGLYDEALIILCSDHGVGFTDRAQGRDNLASRPDDAQMDNNMMNASNLFVVKYPNQKKGGRIDRRNARPYDITPTILNVLGFSEPYEMEGQSLCDETWFPRPRMFRPRSYLQGYMPRLELPEPANYTIKMEPEQHFTSRWLGHSVNELKIEKGYRRPGSLLYLAREATLPGRDPGESDYLLTLTGYSLIGKFKKIPNKTLIAVNGRIVKVIKPSQYHSFEGELAKLGLKQSDWTVLLPPSTLKVGENHITAFSPLDAEETTFVQLRNPYVLVLDEEELRQFGGQTTIEAKHATSQPSRDS